MTASNFNPLAPCQVPVRSRKVAWALLCACLGASSLWGQPVKQAKDSAEGRRLFAQEVYPLLKDKCLACHGENPKKIKGGLEMGSRESLIRGGESGVPVLVPFQPEKSALYESVTWKNEDLQMPPKENDRLTDSQQNILRRWIAAGAPWPDEASRMALLKSDAWDGSESTGVRMKTSGGLSPEWTQRRYKPEDLWAYQPLHKPVAPGGAQPEAHPIDQFIGERLSELELRAAPLADRLTLIRRATFDLIGLPPTPEEVDAFLADPDEETQAFSRLIDRLLASPHYGEHWGRHWLDVVRYADSSGFANDFARGNAWRYRDYVIRSFNEDKPYPEFIREQIAGDELDDSVPEHLVATGFLRMGPWELTSMEVARVARQRFLDDVTDMVGQVFLSHPLQCARCHDHKFDPIPTRDYYALQAVFATTQLSERKAPFSETENVSGFEERQYLLTRKKRYQATLKELQAKEEAAARQWCSERGLDYISRSKGLKQGVPEDKLPPRHVGFAVEDYGMERMARKGIQRLQWQLDRYEPYALSVYSGRSPNRTSVYAPVRMPKDRMTRGQLETSAILAGGDPFSKTIPVSPGVLSVAHLSGDKPVAMPDGIQGRRLALANWIARPDNPLTARSMVNRIWQWHFGQGIAGNPNNFGAAGKKPSHPALLDWLASHFVESGWSVKSLHRTIMLSETYRRSARHPDPQSLSAKDPEGTGYAAFQPRRLQAEELRDSLLRISGELNPVVGGIPVRPEINLEAALQPRMVMGTFAAAWQPSPRPEQRHRRSVYALKIRGQRDPFMEVFNEPSPETSCEGRGASTVTPQVFSLFNSRLTMDRALALAHRLAQEKLEARETIRRAFRLVHGRRSTAEEESWCLDHWNEMETRHAQGPIRHWTAPDQVVRQAVEENTGEPFSFVEPLEIYRDFVPDLQPKDVDARTRALAEVCLVLLNSNEFVYVY